MTITCEVIRDLLPLYHDNVCSNASQMIVEEHLEHCEDCRAELQAMNNEPSQYYTEHNLNEAEAVRKLSKTWRKGMRRSLLKGILLTFFILALTALILYSFIDFEMVPKPIG